MKNFESYRDKKPKYTVLTEQRNNKAFAETTIKIQRASWNQPKSRDHDRGAEWGIYVTTSNKEEEETIDLTVQMRT